MKKKNLIAAFGILLLLVGIAVWFCSFYYRKSNDNLPTFATIAEMEASDVNSLLIGYKRTQLIEVWGEPDSVQENEDVWEINDTVNLKVNYNNKGEAVICGLIESIEEFSFGEFKNLNFSFLSGAGGWSTELIIAEDGNFKGVYHDSDMGAGSEEYPNGTQYYCAFQGKFTQPIKKEDYIYSTTIESISYKYPVGTEEIKDGIRYIYTDAYGLDNPEDILIYLPGMPIVDLPEGYFSWVRSNWRMDYEFAMKETVLPFYGLYNENSEQGFSSYDIIEDLEQSLVYREEEVLVLEDAIMNNPNLTQADLNDNSYRIYQIWDWTLNEIWGILKRNLNEDDMKAITKEQLDWIAMKEASMKDAGVEVEGGSMYGMVVNQRGAKLTRERVYELLEIVENFRD